jgi:polyisoprenyl-phosphate glycosyltransferase
MLSIIIPAYNEENSIVKAITEAHAVLQKIDPDKGEVIVVDDGSSDATCQRARATGAIVIENARNMGYGFAVKRGIIAARNEAIGIVDADGTYPVAEFQRLWTEYQRGIDMVVGARTGKWYRESYMKQALRYLLRKIVEFVAGQNIEDINSGFRIFGRTPALKVSRRLCNTFSYSTSITLAFMMTSRVVSYIQVDYNERVGASKVRLLRDIGRTLVYILQAAAYYNPMKLFLLFSALCLLGSIGFFTLGILSSFVSAFSIAIGLTLLSVMFIGLGLMAEILRAILAELHEIT